MSKVTEITRDSWIKDTFPEWGTWLTEEIDMEKVAPNTVALWWLGCTGIWIKTDKSTNICMDLWCGVGKRSHGKGLMAKGHQMMRMSGCQEQQPNLRNQPMVMDPFKITNVDAIVVSHIHSDHLDVNVAAAVVQNCPNTVKFIGPKKVVEKWLSWGVPENQCVTVKPGDSVKVKDVEICALESFDRTCLVTASEDVQLKGKPVMDMDEMAVNFLFKTSGGNIYHAADSHYSNFYAKHGNEHKIDICLGAFGENPRGITDKMTSIDILRMAESLQSSVVIPVHHDIWTNFQADPNEIVALWNMRKDRLQYKFNPFIWQVGGKFTYPNDKGRIYFQHYRGFSDVFSVDADVPFTAFL
ncbi:MAG: L-ascorbate 6-phosphate lactonase [Brevinema sp.]